MLDRYMDVIGNLRANTRVISNATEIGLDDGLGIAVTLINVTRAERVKCLLFGNGGSLTVADHIANDFNLCAGWRSVSLSSGSNLSAIGNDFGFASTFERQVDWLGRRGDIAVAISCSGASRNIIRGARKAKAMGMSVITLTACDADNELSREGQLNLWVDTDNYGAAQVAHLALLHSVCDIGAASLKG